MQSRVDLFDRPGGDTIQLKKTKEELKKLGVEVAVSLELQPDVSGYDIVHLFNLDRCHETYLQAENAKKQGKKVALSTIHHCFSEIEEYEKKMRYGLRRIVNPVFTTYKSREYLKNFYRAIFDARQRYAFFQQIKKGMRNQQVELLEMADVLLPNAQLEAEELGKEFQIPNANERSSEEEQERALFGNIAVVPNGVDVQHFFSPDPYWFKDQYDFGDFVLCVARIEARKNQLNIIKAVKDLRAEKNPEINLVLVGIFNPNHPEYGYRVRQQINKYDWLHHIEHIPYRKIPSAFVSARVHISASLFETTGLVNCEAGLAGCNVVASNRGYSKEYLQDYAWYCDPYNILSIQTALGSALKAQKGNDEFKQRIVDNYSWKKTGEKTLQAYRRISNI